MHQCFFHIKDESAPDGSAGVYLPTGATVGPWSEQAQHGGPPSALLVRAAERTLRLTTERDDLVARRYAAEFLGPVPVAEVRCEVRVLRAARSAALVEGAISAGARVCLQARVWFVARADTPATASVPLSPDGGTALDQWAFPYAEQLEWRMVSGDPFRPGPAAAWIRPRIPLVAGEDVSSLQRAVLIGDSASGISSQLPWDTWSFANVDLDLHLARDLTGDWLRMEAETVLGPDGAGVARALFSDVRGTAGGGLQTLVVRPTRRAGRAD